VSAQMDVAGRPGRANINMRRPNAIGGANSAQEHQSLSLLIRLNEHRPINQILRSFHLSFRNRMIFLPIGKVANSSIKAFLFQAEATSLAIPMPKRMMPTQHTVHNPYYGPLIKAFQVPKRVLEHALSSDKYFKFVFVRNPYDRLLSCFLDRVCKPGSLPNKHALQLVEKQSVEQITFEEFVLGIKKQAIKNMDPHWRPQYYEAGFDCLTYSFVGRFENLEKDLTHVISTVYGDRAVTALKLSENYSPATTEAQSRLKEFYTDAAIAVVNEVYACDFKEFGYETVEQVKDFGKA